MKIFVPGRICLFGEHSDWAGGYRRINSNLDKGYCIITGTNQGIYAEVQPHPSALVVTADLGGPERVGPCEIPMDPKALLAEAQGGGPFAYVAGVAYQILTHHHVQGLVIDNSKTDLPVKKGLSSSAAVCVLVARAFNRIYDLKMTVRGEMELAYRGELTTPSRCGRMDQGCAFGSRPVLMTFDGDLLDVRTFRTGGDLHMLIVNLKKGKDTQKILSDLNHSYPFASNDLDRGVQEYLGPVNKRIAEQAIRAIETGDVEAVGRLMTEAQALFDRHLGPACPDQLTAPALHKVLGYKPIQDLVWGGKGVGSQGDGCAQLVARDAESRDRAAKILSRDLGLDCLPLDITRPKRIRKAVITAAGFGTRMFPASKAVKKELAPIVDADGLAKPIIQVIVEEAARAGIEEIGIIVQPEDEAVFESYFRGILSPQHFNSLPTRLQEHAAHLESLSRRITFIHQKRQAGFGDAVLCARQWVGDEAFLLMLGDHVYRSRTDEPCAAQLLAAYDEGASSVVGLGVQPPEEISSFGTVGGQWVDERRLLAISEFAEKPSRDYAEAKLRVPGINDAFLCVSGLYALKPSIFEHLQQLHDDNVRKGGEFQLTDALDRMRRQEGCLGVVIQGRAFDTGRPRQYLETLAAFGQGTLGAPVPAP
ncbi:MAG TPA: sugar phosphate nucleotidyltransferase [Phycisphaerae bacterium]|nr:sugar phosphate nucleotidyltransferase [Phycisphaerae bacterium]